MDCPVGNNKANPMWMGNKIIAAGIMYVGKASRVTTHYGKTGVATEPLY
jgi:hypothetical protein